jgi:putative transposase
VKFGFIKEHKKEFSIRAMCRVLEVSVSGYYQWYKGLKSKRQQENEQLLRKIESIHQQSRKQYGSAKVYRQLRQDGEVYNHKRVEHLMRENQLKAKRNKKFKATTNSEHQQPVAENLLNREFRVSQADKVWVSDITYVWTDE